MDLSLAATPPEKRRGARGGAFAALLLLLVGAWFYLDGAKKAGLDGLYASLVPATPAPEAPKANAAVTQAQAWVKLKAAPTAEEKEDLRDALASEADSSMDQASQMRDPAYDLLVLMPEWDRLGTNDGASTKGKGHHHGGHGGDDHGHANGRVRISNAKAIAFSAGVPVEEVLAMRESGLGWGTVARSYGVGLGQARKTFRASLQRPASGGWGYRHWGGSPGMMNASKVSAGFHGAFRKGRGSPASLAFKPHTRGHKPASFR